MMSYVACPMKSSAENVSLSMMFRMSLYWSPCPGYSTLNVIFSFQTGDPPLPTPILACLIISIEEAATRKAAYHIYIWFNAVIKQFKI